MGIAEEDLLNISKNHTNAASAVAHAITSLEAALSLKRYHIRGATQTYAEMRRDMPYIVHVTQIPNIYILVNRNYKPLGSNQPTGGKWEKYEDFKNLHVELTRAQIASVVSPDYEYGLFGDGNPPWRGRKEAKAYLTRLKKLYQILENN